MLACERSRVRLAVRAVCFLSFFMFFIFFIFFYVFYVFLFFIFFYFLFFIFFFLNFSFFLNAICIHATCVYDTIVVHACRPLSSTSFVEKLRSLFFPRLRQPSRSCRWVCDRHLCLIRVASTSNFRLCERCKPGAG